MSDFVRKSDVLDLLYRIFDKYKMSTDKNTSIGKSFGTDVFEEIRNMQTAYDIDKVVEELEKSSKWVNETNEYGDDDGNDYIPLSKAIEIVNHGGVSDDVCEWKLDGVYLHSPHKPLVSCVTDENYRYHYCPVCERKIKVVE